MNALQRHQFALAFIATAATVLFIAPLVRQEVFVLRDHFDYFQPLRWFTAEELKAGRLPLWNPYSASGEPWLANPQTGVFYPPAWLFVVLPFATAYMLFLLFHLVILGWGAYLLFARSASRGAALVGAVALMFSGPVLSIVDVSNNLATFAWIPLALWCAAAGAWRRGAIVLALAFLGGEPFFAAVGAAMYAIVGLARAAPRRIALVALTGVFAFGISAVQLLPFVEYVRLSDRAAAIDPADVLRESMPLHDWPRIAVPPSLDASAVDPAIGQHFIPVVYVGISVIALAILGVVLSIRAARAPWSSESHVPRQSVILSREDGEGSQDATNSGPGDDLIALRGRSSHFEILRSRPSHRPLAQDDGAEERPVIRSRWTKWTNFKRSPTPAESRGSLVIGWLALLAFSVIVAAGPAFLANLPVMLFRYPARLVPFAALAIGGLAVVGWDRLRVERRWLDLVVVLIVVVDLLPRMLPLLRTAPFRRDPVPYAAEIGASTKFLRVGDGAAHRAAWISGYLNLYDRRFDAFTAAPLVSERYARLHRELIEHPTRERLAKAGIGYVVTRYDLPRRFALVARAGDAKVYANAEAWPMAVHRSRATGAVTPARWSIDTSHARVRVDAAEAGDVVLLQQAWPGWRVEVDGKSAEAVESDGIFRGVAVPPGRHEIVWAYLPSSLVLGAAITFVALVAMQISAFVKSSTRRKS